MKKKLFPLLLAFLLCFGALLFSGCDSALLNEAAELLLHEWAAQQLVQGQDEAAFPSPSFAQDLPPASTPRPSPASSASSQPEAQTPVFGEAYYAYQDVADYIYLYEELPPNYITKEEARQRGWNASEGNLWEVAPGACIGGDRFGNYEGNLPDGNWRECDVEYEGGFRNAHRLLYCEEGMIYYTDDHYQSFTRLY